MNVIVVVSRRLPVMTAEKRYFIINKHGVHSCVLRREIDEFKKDLAEMKATQREMKESIQRMTIAVENIEKLCQSVMSTVYSMSYDIVVIAGVNAKDEAHASVERFNMFKQTWTPLAELKVARGGHVAVVFQNQIFVCGGSPTASPDHAIDSIEVLDLNADSAEWKEFCVSLPINVAGHRCVVYKNRLLIFGGSQKWGDMLDTIYELLLVPPYSAKFHGVELFNDMVLIAGGQGAESDVEVFDIERNE